MLKGFWTTISGRLIALAAAIALLSPAVAGRLVDSRGVEMALLVALLPLVFAGAAAIPALILATEEYPEHTASGAIGLPFLLFAYAVAIGGAITYAPILTYALAPIGLGALGVALFNRPAPSVETSGRTLQQARAG